MTFSNALPRLRFAVAPARPLSFVRRAGADVRTAKTPSAKTASAKTASAKLRAGKPRRTTAKRSAPGDANVALIMAVMMSLVFGPVIGVHLIAAFAPIAQASDVVARITGSAAPRG